MEETLKISKKQPEQKSQDYKFLREEGLKYIQEVAGRIWTDYNSHDPGITILEALCYAITDIGYRASYPIEDLLESNKNSNGTEQSYNFHKAGKILPNAPLTKKDYRKILIDTEIEIEIPGFENEYVGVKNAWIEKSEKTETSFYVHKQASKLDYIPDKSIKVQNEIQADLLYNILLEFGWSNYYGDLNENTIKGELKIDNHPADVALEGLIIDVKIECPRWDRNVDWNKLENIIQNIDKKKIVLSFNNLPNNYFVNSYGVIGHKRFEIEIYEKGETTETLVLGNDLIRLKIEDFLFNAETGLIKKYQEKVNVVEKILEKVKSKLYVNRNLCEDFFSISALKVEEIAICADVELDLDADIEQTQAKIFHEIAKFLSPSLNFYTIQEMLDLCKTTESYSITAINQSKKIITVNHDVTGKLGENDTVRIANSTSNDGVYTIKAITGNTLNAKYSDIQLAEDIPSEILSDTELLYATYIDNNDCHTIDTIFEGPLLEHGFIDNRELEKADRKKVIHVSDLIQIIMDIPGVIAVKEIQIANIPQDNDDKSIKSKSVKWCLDLAFDQNYVPRLSVELSKCNFFKENLPFKANSEDVEDILDQLKSEERKQKLSNPKLDFEIPTGKYRNIEDYTSIQEDFPLTYGIGYEGIPNLSRLSKESRPVRIAQARQLKAFLMFFDQLLVDYLAQLAHVSDLFSMNANIERTYYNKPLFNLFSEGDPLDFDPLYINKSSHAAELNIISENEVLFKKRRNKFLDHLLARFSEQFADYAMILNRFPGRNTSADLIEDKLAFLNSYPEISKNRSKGFNYDQPDYLWHINNTSGLQQRVSLLMGIPRLEPESLFFSDKLAVLPSSDKFYFTISDDSKILFESIKDEEKLYKTKGKAKEALELLIINGLRQEDYNIKKEGDEEFSFNIVIDNITIAESHKKDYASRIEAGNDIDLLISVLEEEFFTNHESNRHNLSCAFFNYFDVKYPEGDSTQYEFSLFSEAFAYNNPALTPILTGSFDIPNEENDIQAQIRKKLWELITSGIFSGQYLFSYETDYLYHIGDRFGNILATSVEKNFNEKLKDEIILLNNLRINITNSSANNGYYLISDPETNVSVKGPDIVLKHPAETPVPENTDGNLTLIESYEYTTKPVKSQILIEGDLTEKIVIGDIISIFKDKDDLFSYKVIEVKLSGSSTTLTINKKYTKSANSVIRINKTYPYSFDQSTKTFTVKKDAAISGLAPGDILNMWNKNETTESYDIIRYNIKTVTDLGNTYNIKVAETISKDDKGSISFDKIFPIVSIKNTEVDEQIYTEFTIKGGEGQKAVYRSVELFKKIFINKEGFHLIEHPLLRPKHKQLIPGLILNGLLKYTKQVDVHTTDTPLKMISINGDLSLELDADKTTNLASSVLFNSGGKSLYLTIQNINMPSSDTTEITVFEDFSSILPEGTSTATIAYTKYSKIENIGTNGENIFLPETDIPFLLKGTEVVIENSKQGLNDGEYIVKTINENENFITILRDKLLPVTIKSDCMHQIENPYTCIASVVLPYWPERFNNSDFRKFFERTLRMEAPAHIFLRICWVNPEHMELFEQKYKKWLLEKYREKSNKIEVSNALEELINALYTLRNVYPIGTLFDPEEHETLQNTIILNNTMLGNA